MDSHSRAEMLLIPNVKQTQQEISHIATSILVLDPKSSPEEVQRAATLQVLTPALDRLLVTNQEESDKHDDTVLRDVEQEASQRTQRIFANHERLGLILAQHGHVLQNRWRKKRKIDQRKKLLLEAWPGMPEKHRPDFDALKQQRSLWALKRRRDGAKHRDAYLFPHVNLEDLSNTKNLLLFIESRAHNEPEAFAWSDSQHIKMAASADAVKTTKSNGYTMMLSGQKTQEQYGQIVSWKSDLSSVQDLLTGKGFSLGEGLIVLEIQDRTLHFLLHCTELMLQDLAIKAVATSDLAQTALTVGSGPIFDNGTSSSEQPTEWQSMVEVNTEAAYRLPQQFSLGYLRTLASAKKDEAEDVIWALREDPSFFQEIIKTRYEMTLYLFEHVHNKQLTKFGKEKCMHTACRTTIYDPYKYLLIWDIISADLQKLETLHNGTVTSPVEPLSEEYQDALANFVLAMDELTKYPLTDLRKTLPMTEPIRQYFDCTVEGQNTIYGFRKDILIPPLLEMVYDLMNDERTTTMGVPNILDVVDRIMGQDTAQRDLITTEVAKTLSETATIGEIQTRLSRHQPRIQLPMDLDSSIAKVKSRIELIPKIWETLDTVEVGAFVTPFSEFSYPPLGKTQKNVDKIRAEEAMLDTFWRKVDEHFTKATEKKVSLNGLMEDRITEREIERTPPWQPPVARPKYKKQATPKPTAEELEALRTFQTGQTAPESSTPLATRPKEKVKTRGVAEPQPEPVPAEEPEVEEPPAQTFVLPKGPYRTMRMLFPADVQDRTGAKVLWKDFVSAMQKLDFSITSLQGSASLFEPAWESGSSILLHEPHPGSEIRFDLLRRYGGRLSRKYGWTAETFVQG